VTWLTAIPRPLPPSWAKSVRTSAAVPAPRREAPPMPFASPVSALPAVAGAPPLPAPADPNVPTAAPVPVAGDPEVLRRRWPTDDLDPNCRRRHGDDLRGRGPLRDDDSTDERPRKKERGCEATCEARNSCRSHGQLHRQPVVVTALGLHRIGYARCSKRGAPRPTRGKARGCTDGHRGPRGDAPHDAGKLRAEAETESGRRSAP
jgi:hypothetical protein